MSEIIHFYGPVQGMVRIHDFMPVDDTAARDLARIIKQQGCVGCPRLNVSQRTSDMSDSYRCKGVGWVGINSGAYLYEFQGHAVHVGGSDKCQLIGKTLHVDGSLVIRK